MKLGICSDLYDRAWACADAIGEKVLTRFIGYAVSNYVKGRLDGVAIDVNMLIATRGDRAVITFLGDAHGLSSAEVKLALAKAVVFAEDSNSAAMKPLSDDVMADIMVVSQQQVALARKMATIKGGG